MRKILFIATLLCSHGAFARMAMDTTTYIHTVDVKTGKIDTILTLKKHFEAPNWHKDGYLILNSFGRLHKLDLKTKQLTPFSTGSVVMNNNDHVLSFDQKWIAMSSNNKSNPSPKGYKSSIYVMPMTGGEPKLVTTEVPSYLHGWSVDAKTLVYCGERNGNFDIYTISVNGGEEKRMTETASLDDGPEYSPDGKYIYFNSYRSGRMQIWRMGVDGSNPEQLTSDENSNWFAHIAPNNKSFVYIAYTSDEKEGHPFGRQVKLRMMNLKTKEIKDITPVFFGGQGTINVPSWSPDNKKVAFVSYKVNN